MNSKVINTKLGDIEYCSIGKGLPILFLHGGYSNCKETLCHKRFDLKQIQLITPSRPGYGKTPLNNNKTPKQAADLIVELLNYLSLDNVVVYGISAGGLTAIELAGNYPDKVNKLILASAISKKWLYKQEKKYKTAKILFSSKIEKITWGTVRFFSKIFPNVIAKSFYPEFSKYKIHKLKKEDVQELISSMKYYNSKMGFLNDIDQDINDEIITKINGTVIEIMRYRILGLIIVIIGLTISLYFDGNTEQSAQFEKVGYILFFIGAAVSLKGTFSKFSKKDNK